MQYIDLTHTIDNNTPVYPGDPKPEIIPLSTLAKDGLDDSLVKFGTHTGTHLDSPAHMIAQGEGLAQIGPDNFFGRGQLVDARNQTRISEALLKGKNIRAGDIVLVCTGFDKKYHAEEYYDDHPVLTENFACQLIELGVKIVGLDFPSPDKPPFGIHKLLFKKNILILENLTNLEKLLGKTEFEIIALPCKLATDSAPARVIAKILS